MIRLDEVELDCLRYIAHNRPAIVSPCALQVLQRLVEPSLIEQNPGQLLPQELKHTDYRVTPAGDAALRQY